MIETIIVKINPTKKNACYGCNCFFERSDYSRDHTRCAINCHDYPDSYTPGKKCPGPGKYKLKKVEPTTKQLEELKQLYEASNEPTNPQ